LLRETLPHPDGHRAGGPGGGHLPPPLPAPGQDHRARDPGRRRPAGRVPALDGGGIAMAAHFEISDDFIADQNRKARAWVDEDLEHLSRVLARRGVAVEDLLARAQAFRVAVPSWGLGTGGTRFARFPGPGEPRDVFEKLEDGGTLFKLVRCTPAVSLHIPWDKPESAAELRRFASARGLHFDALNSNP